MKIISYNKTTKLIEYANNEVKLIVCLNKQEAHRIFNTAKIMGCNIHLPITYEEFIKGEYSERHLKSVLIDNVDSFVEYISKAPVEAITLSL